MNIEAPIKPMNTYFQVHSCVRLLLVWCVCWEDLNCLLFSTGNRM